MSSIANIIGGLMLCVPFAYWCWFGVNEFGWKQTAKMLGMVLGLISWVLFATFLVAQP